MTLELGAEPMLTGPLKVAELPVIAQPDVTILVPESIINPEAGMVHVAVEVPKALEQSAALLAPVRITNKVPMMQITRLLSLDLVVFI